MAPSSHSGNSFLNVIICDNSARRRRNSQLNKAKTIQFVNEFTFYYVHYCSIFNTLCSLNQSMFMLAAGFPLLLFFGLAELLLGFRVFFRFACDCSEVVGRSEFWLTLSFLFDVDARFPFGDDCCSTQYVVLFFENWYLNKSMKWKLINAHGLPLTRSENCWLTPE